MGTGRTAQGLLVADTRHDDQEARRLRRAAQRGELVRLRRGVYVFRSKRADRVKLLVWDGSGLVLATKRLEAGQFCWPKIEDGVVRLSAAQLSALVEGLDWKRVHAARAVSVPAVAG